jgi:acetate kinase
MGFTPLEGLVMGTRSGDVDPAILDFIGGKEGMSSHEVDAMLNKQSGLLGISGLTGDMRELLAEEADTGDRRAKLAVDVFCYRVKKYLGAYLAAMNGADAVVFAGGIGERSPSIRARICQGLDWLGIALDETRNTALTGGELKREGRIDASSSRVAIWVIPTDEELLIARDTWRVVTGANLAY